MKNNKIVTITKKRYIDLLKNELKLNLLEKNGVENWIGYHESLWTNYKECSYTKICKEIEETVNEQYGE